MSALKNRIRLQQAQTELERGLITQEAYDQIEADCSGNIVGETIHLVGSSGEGTQLGPADLPPATTKRKTNGKTSTAAVETTPDPGNA